MRAGPPRIAVVGLGDMGRTHLRILSEMGAHVEVAAIADNYHPFVERAASIAPAAVGFGDPLECVNTADVDAVVVATSDNTHYPLVRACVDRGLPVLCEKPLTESAVDSWRLVEAERRAGRQLVQVGYMRRFDSDYRRIHQALRACGAAAPVFIKQLHRNPSSAVRFGAQELISSSASHDIDVFRWLAGANIAEVSATATGSGGSTAVVALTWSSDSGVLGVAELGCGPQMPYDIGCEALTSAGAFTLAAGEAETPPAVDGDTPPGHWLSRFWRAYRSQDASWVSSLVGGPIMGATAYDGYAANAVSDAAIAALTGSGGQLVELGAP
jgi:myo-inositol 2-dehydrogenase/D-chiro-inositol 1-dehydrogenase